MCNSLPAGLTREFLERGEIFVPAVTVIVLPTVCWCCRATQQLLLPCHRHRWFMANIGVLQRLHIAYSNVCQSDIIACCVLHSWAVSAVLC